MTRSMKFVHRVGRYILAPALLLIALECTNLNEPPHDALTPETAFQTDAQILAGMAGIYAQLRPLDNNVGYMSVEGLPTDEIIVPTSGAANAILASLYLNAGVFTKETGINASGYNSCSGVTVSGGAACAAAIAAANAVINSGVYTLNPNWSTNFSPNNQGSPENIFV